MKKRLLIFLAIATLGFALLTMVAWCACPEGESVWLSYVIPAFSGWAVCASAACLAFAYG